MNIRGVEINLHPEGEALSDHIREKNDFFEAHILDYIKEKFPVQDVILDIGANIGNHTLYFQNFLQHGLIFAYEPIPENLELLKKNLEPYPYIVVIPSAVGVSIGSITMNSQLSNMGASKITEGGAIFVPITTIDSAMGFGLRNVTLIKIDVEGYELPVLLGAKNLIERDKPTIMIEDWENLEGQTATLLRRWGYTIDKAWGSPEYTYIWTNQN